MLREVLPSQDNTTGRDSRTNPDWTVVGNLPILPQLFGGDYPESQDPDERSLSTEKKSEKMREWNECQFSAVTCTLGINGDCEAA